MVYCEHFRLEKYPFTLTPDTELFLDYGEFQDALNVLQVSLSSGDCFTKVTGESGTGKTLLCRKLMSLMDECFVTVHIDNPHLSLRELHVVLAERIGLQNEINTSTAKLLELINLRLISLLADGKRVLLIIDEAQTLTNDGMDALRLYSNLETEKNKLLQLVIVGQPTLDTRLNQREYSCLRQRIVFSHILEPLSRDAMQVYMQHRLHEAGYIGIPLFNDSALDLLHTGSGGIPRVINILSHKALLVAFGRGDNVVCNTHVHRAMTDTDSPRTESKRNSLSASFAELLRLKPVGV